MNNPPAPYDAESHAAWLAALSPDESLVVHTPPGYLFTLIVVALTKRALLSDGVKPAEQLELLERMNKLFDQYFTPSMAAIIEPMGNTEYRIFEEAKSLDSAGDKLNRASFEILTSARVWHHLLALNPSYIVALKHREEKWEERLRESAQ